MGLDQELKIIIKKSGWNDDDSDDEWLKWSLERIIYVSKEINKLFEKYPEGNHYYELLYWQWY